MSEQNEPNLLVGTGQDDTIEGTSAADLTIGLAGDDALSAGKGEDTIYGDFIGQNLLQATEDSISFDQYGASGSWTVGQDEAGNAQMSQTVTTMEGAEYEIAFEVAANHAAGMVSGRVEVLWDGEAIGTIDTSSGVFADAVLNFTGTGGEGELTFRALPGGETEGPEINTDGPVFWYDKTVEIGGEEVQVKAFAEGQANIYQVLDGELNIFDPATETYTPAGAEATVVVNAIGFNQQDDLIYGIAVKNGTDALGNPVAKTDLVMYDAEGHAYRVGETPYRSWTGDFDENGNLWAFESDIDRITMIDVDEKDADGNPVTTTFKYPSDLVTDKLWDVAYDTESKSFYGLVRPSGEGEASKLIKIDISDVEAGGDPIMTSIAVTGTMVDGEMQEGLPAITFGAFVIDGDGNFYAGGNGGDHDMDDATGISGGIYRINITDEGDSYLELVSDAPRAYSNDGAVDPRSMDPFTEFDPAAVVLIRGPQLYEAEDPSGSYDDNIHAGAGKDLAYGGYGEDVVVGSSLGDELHGDVGADALYGGAGPDYVETGLVSVYDDQGLRYDQFGNLLPEDDDVLFGGSGSDLLDGSAGHDTLHGGEGNDTLQGGSGRDRLYGDEGDDQLSGGREDDVLSGGEGADRLEGGSGEDTLMGDKGDDTLLGGSGADSLHGGNGDDTVDGGSGDDTLFGEAGNDTLAGGSGDDTLSGGFDNDSLSGGSGGDTLNGDEGNDQLKGGRGDDVLHGGAGKDKLNGGSDNDTLFGDEGNDYLNGYDGNDTLYGGEGDDKILFGKGVDVAFGGTGSDKFVLKNGDLDGSENRIADFVRNTSEEDQLDLRGLNLHGIYEDALEWLGQQLSAEDNGDVVLELGGSTSVRFIAHDAGPAYQDDFRDDILDGLLI